MYFLAKHYPWQFMLQILYVSFDDKEYFDLLTRSLSECRERMQIQCIL